MAHHLSCPRCGSNRIEPANYRTPRPSLLAAVAFFGTLGVLSAWADEARRVRCAECRKEFSKPTSVMARFVGLLIVHACLLLLTGVAFVMVGEGLWKWDGAAAAIARGEHTVSRHPNYALAALTYFSFTLVVSCLGVALRRRRVAVRNTSERDHSTAATDPADSPSASVPATPR